MKTGHFESGIASWATGVALARDEPTQREPATFHYLLAFTLLGKSAGIPSPVGQGDAAAPAPAGNQFA